MSNDSEQPKRHSATIAASVVAIAIIILWLLTWILLQGDTTNRGTWGDMFGGINSLFSGLAFVGVVYAILLQREELQLQRSELISTREEIRGQREANELQNTFIARQIFENTLFQMIGVLENVLDAIDKRSGDGALVSKGRDTIRSLYGTFQSIQSYDLTKNILDIYDEFYLENGDEIGHYYRVLYNVFKFIESSDIDQKDRYVKIVRAQLSDYEVAMLFYNSLTPRGEKFLTYINQYALLKFTRPELLVRVQHVEMHDKRAFGSRYEEISGAYQSE